MSTHLSSPAHTHAAWMALAAHQAHIAPLHLRDLFAQNPQRYTEFSRTACDLYLDFSKNRLTHDTLDLLFKLADASDLQGWRERLFNGVHVNNTEDRAAAHIALRSGTQATMLIDGQDVTPAIKAVLEKMQQFSTQVRSGEWRGHTGKAITALVNIGIGGSDLGPKMVTEALRAYHHPRLTAHFDSNLDATQLNQILAHLDPETTLFIVASKTFSTQETLTNARSARRWLVDKLGDEAAVSRHFVAVSTHTERVKAFGIDPANMFEFWDWVGGRYSLWSAIGLSVMVMIGPDNHQRLLAGARQMDAHFRTAPLADNLPVLLGLIGVWYSNFFKAATQAILPYDYALKYLPHYLQQLEMESNGKRVDRDGATVDYATCPVIWGMAGNNGQHAFYQLLHQGTQLIPSDFIIAAESQSETYGHQNAVLANALAQTQALMQGRNQTETSASLGVRADDPQIPHRVFPGNQPSNTILYRKLTPEILGSLIALYEHKVFVQSVCWHINPFDQWGVELGKQMAAVLLPELESAATSHAHDASTNGLLNQIKQWRSPV